MKLSTWIKFLGLTVVLAIPGLLITHLGNAAGDAGHEGGIPMVLWLQVINFVLYMGLVVYLAKKPIQEMFQGRYDGFFSALKKAEAAKAEAEAKRKEIQDRLTKLETTREESIQKAREEAAALRNQIVEEAKSLSSKLKADAEKTAIIEIERAKTELREDLLAQSVVMAKRILTDKMQEQDQKRLQTEFVDKIGAVSQ
ncbi:MAG: ATP synthase F0 subunit B [Bdellovibrionales bacterium]|nr:ATP synthase F0 subunit B [Bdellovibrionales bacterium]